MKKEVLDLTLLKHVRSDIEQEEKVATAKKLYNDCTEAMEAMSKGNIFKALYLINNNQRIKKDLTNPIYQYLANLKKEQSVIIQVYEKE